MKSLGKGMLAALVGWCLTLDAGAQETAALPFEEDFATSESMTKFSTLDVNADGETWKYYTISECARYSNLFTPSDDWLLTPKLPLKEGYTYRMQCKVKGKQGNLEIGLAASADAEALGANILVAMKDYNSDVWEDISVEVVCEATGDYVFGFHTNASAMFASVDVDEIRVEEIAAPAPQTDRLYGTILVQGEGSDLMSGIYGFDVKEQIELEPLKVRTDYIANGGGCYLDGKYLMNFFLVYPDKVMTVFHKYDMVSGEMVSVLGEDKSWVATDMAYDPTTDQVYCCSFSLDGGYVLSILDQTTGRKTPVAPLDYMVAMAVDKAGILYGIDSNGTLWKINKFTAEKERVGETGLTGLGKMAQSATIDPETGKFFWAAANDTESGLYVVDPLTAEATLVGRFPHDEHMGGIFAEKPFFADGVPARPEEMELTFEGAALEGVCRTVVPATLYDGTESDGLLTAYLVANGDTLAVQEGVKPGEELTMDLTVKQKGMYCFALNFTNGEGYGRPVSVRKYVGLDRPAPVTEVTLEARENGQMQVTWKAPETGVNGGFADAENLTYDIQRYPELEWVAEGCETTEWTDVLEKEGMCTYSYGVVAVNADGERSDMIVSNFVTVGDVLDVPFLEKFEIPQTFATYTVVDANKDGYSWIYNTEQRAAIYEWSLVKDEPADDWLISPKFRLEKGLEYKVGIDAVNSIPNHPERMRVVLGTDTLPETMDRELIGVTTIDDATGYTHLEQTFTAEADGLYRLGVHVCSEAGIGDLLVKNISLEKTGGSGIAETEAVAGQAFADGQELVVRNDGDREAAVLTPDGRTVAMVAPQAEVRLALPAGVYLVRLTGGTVKVVL